MAGVTISLSGVEMVVGQSETADIVLESQHVSRKHALITVDASLTVTIRDLNSTAGTFINGEQIEVPCVLRSGDVVRFADIEARFEPGASAPPDLRQWDAPTEILPEPERQKPESTATECMPQGGEPVGEWPPEPSGDGAAKERAVRGVQAQLVQLGYAVPAEEEERGLLGKGTRAALEQFQSANQLPPNGTPDADTVAALTSVIAAHTYVVTGTAQSPALPGAQGVAVALVDKNVGGEKQLDAGETGSDGTFSFSVVISPAYLARLRKSAPDLQVQASAGGKLLASSEVRYSAPLTVTLNVALPATATGLPSEYETLTANLAAVYKGSLGDLEETATRQDITYLGNKTGWDARAVALAALADQFSQISVPSPAASPVAAVAAAQPAGIQPEFYYALFRAGLPANADTLFQASADTVQAVWEQAIAQGVIPQALTKEIPAAAKSFQTLSVAHLLTAAPTTGVSTLQEMLQTTLPEQAQQEQFAELYAQSGGEAATFWPAVEQAFGAGRTAQLKLTGQLFYLTLNNQPLVEALTRANGGAAGNGGAAILSSPAELVARGYYEASAWAPLIGKAVPGGIPGGDPAEQASNYAELLAAQIRLAYPTAVMADQVRRRILPVADTAQAATDVADFLTAYPGQFEIGVEPVEAFIARMQLTGVSDAVVTQVKRLQRAYQMTPDDSSLAVLLRHNLDSAYAITRYDPAGFVRAFADELGGADAAAAIHARARLVFVSVLSLAVEYLKGRVTPTIGGERPIQHGFPPQSKTPTVDGKGPIQRDLQPEMKASSYPVVAYPTLEELFGSLDYCNCSECGSILSPAAYLVDLLHYVDQPAPTAGLSNPQDVLFERRPDLQYLPLTCANTNTALPYIDIVNETLEYYVANGLSIAGYPGHDTGAEVTSAELIAGPQFVDPAVYAILRDAFFPPPLPFNRPLELLRFQLQHLGITLADAMAALRTNDDLLNRTTPTSYGWSDILIEQLGVSRDEYRLFTDASLELGDLYGLPKSSALATLQNASLQDFSRRLGVSYDDLVAIVKTQFINPNAALIPLLERLDCSFATLKQLHDTLSTPQSIATEFKHALPAGLDATAYGATSPDDYDAVVAWVTDPSIYPRIMDIITITNASGAVDDCSGAVLQLRYSNPDGISNLLSGTDFIKLIRFIRLWQKLAPLLGQDDNAAAIADTDHVLVALYPPADEPTSTSDPINDPANRQLLDKGFAAMLLRLGILVQVMNLLSLSGDSALAQLLACWAPIGTVGANALYQEIFLTLALLQEDPGAQIATVASAVNAGDVLSTAINVPIGQAQVHYTVAPGEDATSVASAIAAAINSSGAIDPVSNVALDQRFFASSDGPVITIRAGFTLTCTASAGATETYGADAGAGQSPVARTATLTGSATPGDMLTTSLDGVPVPYTVAAADTLPTVAAGIAVAINATTAPDPFSGLPLNDLVVATSAGPTVTIIAANAGAPFTLGCSLGPANAGTYTAGPVVPAAQTATITGVVKAGDTLVTTINTVPIPYTASAGDSDASALATSIAATIRAAAEADPATGLPLSSVVTATSAAGVITIIPVDPGVPFTLQCSVSSGGESYVAAGPFPESVVATVQGAIPAGVVLTTTINALPVSVTAPASEPASTLAAAIASKINSTVTGDRVTGLPLNSVVAATSTGGAVTITARSVTTPFTVAVSLSASGYTAGQQLPPFADNGSGMFLTDPSQTLFGHEPTLCAACNITGAEFALITSALGFDASTKLTLENVSAVFRYGWLAHALGLSVLEFLLLREYTGLDPFAPLDPGAAAPAEPPAIRFVRLLGAISAAGLNTEQALYLIWNQDISGTSSPSPNDVNGLAVALRADFAAVASAFALRDDPGGKIAQSLMTLVYGSAATGFFFGLLNNTMTTSVTYSAPPGLGGMPQPVIDSTAGRLSYDGLRKQLSFAGVLEATAEAAIEAALGVATSDATAVGAGKNQSFTPASMTNIHPGSALLIDTGAARETVIVTAATATGFTANTMQAHNGTVTPFPIVNDPAFATAIGSLAVASEKAVGPFFVTYPELAPLYEAFVASSDPPQAKRTALLASFLPILKTQRKQEQALASLTSAAGTDPSFASALLQDATILHADSDPTAAAVTDLTAIEHQGLSAQFFLSNDLNAAPDRRVDAVPALSYAQTATIGGAIPAGELLTTTINGVAVPYNVGAFTLTCSASPGATESLTPPSQPPAVVQTVTVGASPTAGDTLTTTIDGVPVPYTVLATDTPPKIAAGIAAAVNATTVEDPAVGAPLNTALIASSAGDVVTITVAAGSPATVRSQVAGGVAAAINATTLPDPATKLPLNQVVVASASGGTITLAGANPSGSGGSFSLACAVSNGAATSTYTAGSQLPSSTGGGAIAATWSGYITAPQSGAYDIQIATDPGAELTLEVAGAIVPLGRVGGLWSNQSEISLVAGVLVPITLTAGSIKTTLSVSWQSLGLGWQLIPGQYLYSLSLIEQLGQTYVRFLKAASVAQALALTAAEIAYLGTETSFSVKTTSASKLAAGPATFTPASIANIEVGSVLVIDAGSAQETVTVTATTPATVTTPATFTALTTKPHDGTATPFPIVSHTYPVAGHGWLNSLTATANNPHPPTAGELATAASLGNVLNALLDFARIKQALSPSDGRVLAVLQNPAATLPSGQPALLSLTGWSQVSLDALLTQFFASTKLSNLASVENFRRVFDAYALVHKSGLTGSSLIAAITNAPSPATVSALQSAVRARYAQADWLTVIKPINNTARIRQRDALVAYILQQKGDSYAASLNRQLTTKAATTGATQLVVASTAATASAPAVTAGMSAQGTGIPAGTVVTAVAGTTVTISSGVIASLRAGSQIVFSPSGAVAINTADSLYEYLLIDPETQPPVLTSRIRLALSTVQLFIERVVRNLEPRVAPADIDATQWTWMKRYRVWQANREVFLWPENWLYPELRDNQSPFFQQAMSGLLQGDITDDAATTAYLDYLTNLEEVAKLEACGMYYDPATAVADETAYVVARTAGANRKHYFRELTGGSWTPWAEAQIDCEDVPITPIVWNGRLFLFWLKVIKQIHQRQPSADRPPPAATGLTAAELQQFSKANQAESGVFIGGVLCWSEYYNGKWQPTKTSDVNLPTQIIDWFDTAAGTGPSSFEQSTRGLLRIVPAHSSGHSGARAAGPAFPIPAEAKLLTVVLDGETSGRETLNFCGGFLLHNTHSLPVRLDDIKLPASPFGVPASGGPAPGDASLDPLLWAYLDRSSPSRSLGPIKTYTGKNDAGTFTIVYENSFGAGAVWRAPVLEYSWMPRFVQPQFGLADAWDAPFIYEDRRRVFYVTTTETFTSFPKYDGFGVPPGHIVKIGSTIPKLTLQHPLPSPASMEAAGDNMPSTDVAAARRYLAEAPNLKAALNSPLTVIYQGKVISSTGSASLTRGRAAEGNARGA